jgi:hypothetical protein
MNETKELKKPILFVQDGHPNKNSQTLTIDGYIILVGDAEVLNVTDYENDIEAIVREVVAPSTARKQMTAFQLVWNKLCLVWPYNTPPKWDEIIEVMHSARVTTTRGSMWTRSNIVQRFAQQGFNRDDAVKVDGYNRDQTTMLVVSGDLEFSMRFELTDPRDLVQRVAVRDVINRTQVVQSTQDAKPATPPEFEELTNDLG